MTRLLLIEDERVIRSALKRMLERNGFQLAEAASIPDAEANHRLADFDLIISDLRLPGPEGTEVIARAGGVPVLIMTSYGSIKSAVDAMQQGAADYIAKPFKHEELLSSIQRVLDKRRDLPVEPVAKPENSPEQPIDQVFAGIVGRCQAMRDVFRRLRKVAPTDTTVLVLGESGTGKELIARALHEHSPRRDAPLIAVNCASIPENLIESELFGHERGAFTGAVGSREGLVEAADGGTLFLDEIGELPLSAQARLLRVLQEGEIRRLGTARASKVDLRLIAATNRDVHKLVGDGQMRNDLYYRLRVMEIHLPPLRERGDDLDLLASFIVDRICRRLGRAPLELPASTLAAIRAHPWPGNVRELENAIEQAVILTEGDTVEAAMLAIDADGPVAIEREAGADNSGGNLSLDDYFRHYVLNNERELTETELARRLGISRKSLWERRQRLGIPRARGRSST